MCRGLIVDAAGMIVARPFPKFFNLSEMPADWKVPEEPFTVHRKEDGSLGILYRGGDAWAVATRGSFTSEQALHATQVLQKRYAHLPWEDDKTYLFEIIYPENRIILDYGAMDDLILLAVLDTATGKDCPLPKWIPNHVFARADILNVATLAAWSKTAVENEEGFVVRFESGLRLKIKYDEYVRLHRLVTGVTARSIWELLAAGNSVDDLLQRVPEEFEAWVKETVDRFCSQFTEIEERAKRDFERSNPSNDRRAFALEAKSRLYPSILFAMYDNKPYDHMIWKMIKPKAERPFKKEDDE